jgi:hypothetical protein
MCIFQIVARQRLGKNVAETKNTHATVEDLMDSSFSMRSVSHQRKVGNKFFPQLLVVHFHYNQCTQFARLISLSAFRMGETESFGTQAVKHGRYLKISRDGRTGCVLLIIENS